MQWQMPYPKHTLRKFMETFKTLIWFVNIAASLALIVLVLVQQGKGADAGASFGSGSATGIFGASGSANFLSRSTAVAATCFFITCLALGYMSSTKSSALDFSNMPPAQTQSVQPTEGAGQEKTNHPLIPE